MNSPAPAPDAVAVGPLAVPPDLVVVIRALMAAVAEWGGRGWLGQMLVVVLYRRLGVIAVAMARLAARRGARVAGAGGVGGRAEGVPAVMARIGAARLWPLGFGWLVRLMGHHAAGYGSQLRAVLGTPAMAALLEATPQAVRVLRPLCRMLAVENSVLRVRVVPGMRVAAADAAVVVAGAGAVTRRVARPRPPGDVDRVALPRGVVTAVRRGRLRTRP